MTPPLQDCLKNPPVKDEIWDTCVRKSSIGIGIGGLLGAVSSIFLGSGGVILSMGLCVTWAVNHCRSLFTEQARARKELLQLPPCQPPPPPSSCEKEPPICEKVPESKEPVCDTLPVIEQPSRPSFKFPSIFPIPDRPFGRTKKEDDECDCAIVDKSTDAKDSNNYKIECTCPIPKTEGEEHTESSPDNVPDFIIECTSSEADSNSPPAEPFEGLECTCPKIEEPELKKPEPIPTEPKCTCQHD